jgi:hypothetical protein
MFYKNWPYWLKGGAIFSLLYLIAGLIIYFRCHTSGGFGGTCLGLAILFLAISFPGLSILKFLGTSYSQNPTLGIIFTAVSYFIIGTAIGLIYGKIKDLKNKN